MPTPIRVSTKFSKNSFEFREKNSRLFESHIFCHLIYLIPKSEPQNLPWLYFREMGAIETVNVVKKTVNVVNKTVNVVKKPLMV